MKLARETWALIIIGIADLISTIYFIQRHGASEANPLFRHYWEMGLPDFIAAKVALLACPLLILEWARRRKPRLVAQALRCAIAGYVIMYGIGVARLNMPPALANGLMRRDTEDSYPPATKEEVTRLLEQFHRLGKNSLPAPCYNAEVMDDAE